MNVSFWPGRHASRLSARAFAPPGLCAPSRIRGGVRRRISNRPGHSAAARPSYTPSTGSSAPQTSQTPAVQSGETASQAREEESGGLESFCAALGQGARALYQGKEGEAAAPAPE